MNMNINISRLFDHIQNTIEHAQSLEEVEQVMDDAKNFLLVSFSIKED